MKYEIKFFGRKIGALGVSGTYTLVVSAGSVEEARLKAYETHEHISGGADGVAAYPAYPGREQTLDRLRGFGVQSALVGYVNQDLLGISRRDGETVAEAIARAEADQ